VTREAFRIDRDPEVRQIAKALGVGGSDLRGQLTAYAVEKVRRHMDRFGIEPQTLDHVHEAVLDLTRVSVKRVENDGELRRLSADFKNKLPVQLEFEFGRNTEALVVREPEADPRSPSFTAIVDARGDRRWRAWFAERHEPVHVLLPDPSGKVAWRRTTAERPEPVEQVIDAAAATVAFWEPLVGPALIVALGRGTSVLDAFDRVRRALSPDASVEASYRAFARLVRFPLTLVRTGFGCRRSDPKNKERSYALRAVTVIRNGPAEEAGIEVWQNFRIPAHSVLHEAQSAAIETTMVQDDDLNAWRTEGGRALSSRPRAVRISVRGSWATIEVNR
jgi:hypothetical protein